MAKTVNKSQGKKRKAELQADGAGKVSKKSKTLTKARSRSSSRAKQTKQTKSKQGQALAVSQAKMAAKKDKKDSKKKQRKASERNKKGAKRSKKSKKATDKKLTEEEFLNGDHDIPTDVEAEGETSSSSSEGASSSEEEEPKKVYNRTKKKKFKKIKKHEELPVYVVDEHDGSMVCLLRNIETGHLPLEGIKLVHFDSHPDLGNIPDEWDGYDEMHSGKYSIRELYDTTDIATWITPMSLMGHVNFVVWACAYWCDQFNPGTWKLLVGKDKNDGKIKIAAPGNKKLACLEYWESGDTTCNVEDFEYYKEWTLMVVRYGKNCRLPEKQRDRLKKELSTGTWVLDIDEDFFSCNNPYFDEFRDLFGEKTHKMISKIYGTDPEDTSEMEETLLSMFRNKSYKKSWSRFSKSSLGKNLLNLLNCPNKNKVLKEFHAFLRKNWPHGGMDDNDSEDEIEFEGWDVRDFFTLDDLHRTGQLACLPHHISSAKEIKELVNEVDALFDELPNPAIVTVATSRLDRYLPDSQAATIHSFVETMLTNRFEGSKVIRLDKPHFSVDSGESGEVKKNSRFVTEILEPEPEDANSGSSAKSRPDSARVSAAKAAVL